MSNSNICPELNELKEVRLEDHPVCIECVQTGDRWVHLRTCQTCGETRCCDDSKNKHATKHYHLSGHPVIASAEPGERWLWCFKHEQWAEW